MKTVFKIIIATFALLLSVLLAFFKVILSAFNGNGSTTSHSNDPQTDSPDFDLNEAQLGNPEYYESGHKKF